ncbi:MAG: hypothetical protein MZV70_61630 [Desulfobacterales bacterium]|nr:hypothetical protein [Desulfobacterales bacterium]
MGMAAAELHQPVAAVGVHLCPQCLRQPFGTLAIAELVNVFHRLPRGLAVLD